MNKLKNVLFVLAILILVVFISFAAFKIIKSKNDNPILSDNNDEPSNLSTITQTGKIEVVPTMLDDIFEDSAWCATFQLVWNDMKNEVVKQDIIFNPQEIMAENLNKEEFTEDMLSDEYYYKVYGIKTKALRDEIEKGIMEKFGQTSDILDDFDWSESAVNDLNDTDINRYFFYTMLYREFDFKCIFDKFEKGNFGKEYENIEYFGVDKNSREELGKQLKVLYYNSQDDFAILVQTQTNDEVIFCKNPKGNNFNEIYDNMIKESSNYTGKAKFQENDEFKAPKLKFNVKKEYKELEGKMFNTLTGHGIIEKAIQTIEFELNEKGGKIKSEAAIDMKNASISMQEETEPRYFYIDDTFALFLREEGRDKPYFAARISDITKYQ